MGISAGASAQANPELGDTGGTAQGSGGATFGGSAGGATGGTWQPPAGTAEPAAATDAPAEDTAAPGTTDHSAVVGTFGVGFFGIASVPVGCNGLPWPAGGCSDTVSAPTIGLRYWLDEGLGIEAALGFGTDSGGGEARNGTTTTTFDEPSRTAFALHGGVPLVLADSQHFVFEIVPELNLGLGFGSQKTPNAATDVSMSGYIFQLGARAGAEIHFGFIDLPKLALQAGVGLHLTASGRSSSIDGPPVTEGSSSHFNLSTTFGGDEPWDIFTGNIAAIYYF